jgi:hypothetical protein
MTREDIIRMAREAEIDELMQMMPRVSQKIQRFAALVAAAEREACALIGDGYHDDEANCGDAIRARGQA